MPLVGKKLVTDAGIFVKERSIPTICYGPNQQSAHGDVEYVDIDELEKTTRIYLHLLEDFLGLE